MDAAEVFRWAAGEVDAQTLTNVNSEETRAALDVTIGLADTDADAQGATFHSEEDTA